jgi:NAD(P)H-nitrite reductase large subunit
LILYFFATDNVGGSSGRNARAGELLCVAGTNEEAIEIIIVFIQYYRETANYLERTWQWLERLGLIHYVNSLFSNVACCDLESSTKVLISLTSGFFSKFSHY